MTLLESADTAPTKVLSHRRPSSNWTEERVDLLRKLWADGISASQIAVEIGGITRNAVLGKKDRLGLHDRCKGWGAGAPIQHGQRSRFNRPQLTEASMPHLARNRRPDGFHRSPIGQPSAPVIPIEIDAPSPHACALADLDDTNCHFPIGEPGKSGFHFCGGRAPGEGPYCGPHSRIAYRRAG